VSVMRCERCQRILAKRLHDGSVFLRQRGREVYATHVHSIRCEECRHTTTFKPRGSVAPAVAPQENT